MRRRTHGPEHTLMSTARKASIDTVASNRVLAPYDLSDQGEWAKPGMVRPPH